MTDQEQKLEPMTGAKTLPSEIPPELMFRRDRRTRLERGARVYATDGLVGNLRQVVVDEVTGEVTALVSAPVGTPRVVLMPLEVVDRTAGSAIFITMSRGQFTARVPRAPEYDKRRFVKANVKALVGNAGTSSSGNPRKLVIRVGRYFIETPNMSLAERPAFAGALLEGGI